MIRSSFIRSLLSYPRRGQFLMTPRGQFSMARDMQRYTLRLVLLDLVAVRHRQWSLDRVPDADVFLRLNDWFDWSLPV
ncbi:hypothetical protein AS156_13365 [Bradyrhizobium macuxiense]|uniref:Uncharacterized protein n=1 Tax=Bradyrhizobium macuxiense TaxID=1755647 RepID=A0A120FKU6_9BRAD|nr:hypothetical protein AS156_13365 [Bradyrhizobium macuxiense]